MLEATKLLAAVCLVPPDGLVLYFTSCDCEHFLLSVALTVTGVGEVA